jgi:hypothetical protein
MLCAEVIQYPVARSLSDRVSDVVERGTGDKDASDSAIPSRRALICRVSANSGHCLCIDPNKEGREWQLFAYRRAVHDNALSGVSPPRRVENFSRA